METDKDAKQQLADKIKSSGNILVTVSRNPSVDALAAAVALTLALDKLGKHATAVFSGKIPPAINFLEPEKTFENNADSLRDFVISLDKDKADRLRFKPDGDMVRIYITPYKTKLSVDDLSFSDGDFNIELVIAIGVDSRDELDDAIASQGRILHSAIAATIGLGGEKDQLGSISWQDDKASGYSELVNNLVNSLSNDKDFVDTQIATALLTGLVSATDQFRNAKTSASVMTIAANLMAKGANQQLVASELSETDSEETLHNDQPDGTPKPERDGLLISHEIDDSEKWNSVKSENQQINERDTALANEQAQQAIRETQASLKQLTAAQNPAAAAPTPEPTQISPTPAQIPIPTPTPVPTPPTMINPPVAGMNELDKIVADNAGAPNILDTANNQQSAESADLSHGEAYINDSVSPLNAALLNEDSNANSMGSVLGGDNHVTIAPPATASTPANPYADLPLPPTEPAENNAAAPTPTAAPESFAIFPTNNDGLPPVPPLNANPTIPTPIDATDISSLTQSAAQLAESAAPFAPAAPTTPTPTASPMISSPALVADDPGRFHIPGM